MEPRKSLRWIKTSLLTDEAFRGFQDRLLKAPYTEKIGTGFLVDKLTANVVEATYVERKLRKSEIRSPMGGIQKLEWFEFTTYPFTFDRRRRVVEVGSAARSLSPLVQQFGALSGWASSFEPLVLKPSQLLDFLRTEKVKFELLKLKAEDVTLSANTSASLDAYGQKTVLKDVDLLLGSRKRSISGLTILVSEQENDYRIEVSLSGRVTLEGSAYDRAANLCRRAVMWAQEPGE